MKTRPITFGAPMVRAILEGRKTQTRRVVKIHPSNPVRGPVSTEYQHVNVGRHSYDNDKPPAFGARFSSASGADLFVPCPYGVPGERLWVREPYYTRESDGITLYAADQAFKLHPSSLGSRVMRGRVVPCGGELLSPTQLAEAGWVKRNSMFMPRSASRITLEVVSVRVERVQDISEEDATAEGVSFTKYVNANARFHFRELWDDINGSRGHGWDANPWVWRIEFRVVTT